MRSVRKYLPSCLSQTERLRVRGGVPLAVTLLAVVAFCALPAASGAAEPFGISEFKVQPTESTRPEETPEGDFRFINEPYSPPFTQAGGHPWALTTTLVPTLEEFKAVKAGERDFVVVPTRDPKDLIATLPPGLLGDPLAVPRCSLTLVTSGSSELCPADTQLGVYLLRFEGGTQELGPIINVTPEKGQSAEFALENTKKVIPILLTAHLVRRKEVVNGREEEAYGFTLSSREIPEVALSRVELTFWGVPAAPNHFLMRGRFCKSTKTPLALKEPPSSLVCEGGFQQSGVAQVPFLTMPTDCSAGPEAMLLRGDSWQEPGSVKEGAYTGYAGAESVFPGATGCDRLSFNPSIEVQPDKVSADEPVELNLKVKVPLNEDPASNATPQLRNTLLTLPQGMSVSPGIVDGIQACNATGPEGINISGPESEEETPSGELRLAAGHCPDASIVGEAEAITPFLPVPVKGHIYLARPGCGGEGQAACTEQDALDGNLYRLYLELGGTGEDANTGIEFKVPLETEADPATGQLTTRTLNTFQAPFSELKIKLNGGPRAPLANPSSCGTALTTSDFTPWSAPGVTPQGVAVPGTPDAAPSSFFKVEGCAPGGPAFNPGFSAGTVSPQAGAFSTFTLNLSRQDREQYFKGIEVHTPPGLLGMLSSVPLCEEPQADAGTCPEAAKIGTTRVASGAGSHPFEIEGNVYLTKGYGGAPFGLSIVTNVVAGPFHLGLVVVRARIAVNPENSTLTVTTDETGAYAVPQIVFGVPLRLKRITVNIDRPGFMFNPTNCTGQQVTANISGSHQTVAGVSSAFAAASCKSLAFKPGFAVATSGHTSKTNGASLDAKVTYPAFKAGSEANIAYVKVELPKQLPSRLTTLQQACTAAQFDTNPAGCPSPSIVGIARASTPLLPVGLEGPVYFVSHGGEAFPSLIVVLQGDGVRVDLTGATFISKSGITSSTFKTVPDVPVNSFELYLPEGKFSALAANGTLCTEQSKLKMPTEFVGQNGAVVKQSTAIAVSGCRPQITVSRKSVKGNTATITAAVPGSGRLTATGTDLSRATGKIGKAGNITVKLRLTRAGTAVLKKHKGRKLEAKVKLTFTPTKGSKLTTTTTVLVGGQS